MRETYKVEISKRFIDYEPAHWEVDVFDLNGDFVGGASRHTFDEIMQVTAEIIKGGTDFWEEANPWVEFEGNES